MLEIERKWIASEKLDSKEVFNDLKEEFVWAEILQIYIQSAPNEVRVRRYNFKDGSVKYEKTSKIGVGLVREEYNQDISFEEFAMFDRTYPLRVSKTRIFENKYGFEIDYYPSGLVTVEKEFESEELAKEYHIPNDLFLGEEITGQKKFSNYQIALDLAKIG